jgi:tetratricopeptide (TPR) repeat protein
LLILRLAAQLAVIAQAPDSVAACETVDVSVVVRASGRQLPTLVTPSLRPFDVLRHSLTRIEYRSDGSGLQAEYRVTLATDQTGDHAIPSFEARSGSQVARSQPFSLNVRPARGRARPAVVARARIDTSVLSSLRSVPAGDTIYVGQQATYEVAVFLNQAARERLRRNPTFYPPEMQAMLAYDLAPPSPSSRDRGSQCFDALVYRRALFPLVAGRIVIPPAQLVYSTGMSPTSLFSREESHELQTDSVTIVAIHPPAATAPADYSGAVGSQIRLETALDSASSRVGGPMLFTVRVAGIGNVKLFPRPAVRVPWAGLVPADERVEVDSSSARIGGAKEFDWVLTPRIAGEFDAPRVRYGYFDPARRRYDVAEAGAGRVRVNTGALASADTGQTMSTLAIRTRYAGRTWPPLQSRPEFWLVMALAPLPAIVGRMRRRSARVRAAAAPNRLQTLVRAPAHEPVSLRRQYVRALAERLGCNPEDFTHPGALRRALRRAGVSEDTSDKAERLLRELDAAAYDRTTPMAPGTAAVAAAVARDVDSEALARRELPLWIPALVMALALGTSAVTAIDPAANHFARGVSSYLREDFGAAQEAFATSATIEPRSADAWANFGTAAWNFSDTAAAVLGWRQAMALEPSAADVRERLDVVRELRAASPGWAPSLPRNALVYTFAILWLATWGAAWFARRPHPWAARLPIPLGASALLIGVMAIEVESRVAGERVAIVRRAVSLSSDPALGMDRGPAVGTGEMVKIVGRRGIWIRVEGSADRDGWLSASDVHALSDRRPPR